MNKNWFHEDYKVIRDSVHGDILIEKKYLDIVNTPEFQRLRRIKQLSVANIVFPGADHTRFSHSIGTFYVMRLILNHLKKEFNSLDSDIDDRDIDLALVSALVHDIGHGPFSHAFEKIIYDNQKSHEQWTIDIINSKKTNVNKFLRRNFDEKFPKDVSELIEKGNSKKKNNELNISKILTNLVSSQLDADRLDYLVRDSYNTGVKFGNIDLERLISSLKITIHKNEYSLYIPIKYLHDIEEYLFSRFQMNKSVYYHPAKVEFEEIIKLIFKRAIESNNSSVIKIENKLLMKVFSDSLSVQEFCEIDENLIIATFQNWLSSEDKILSKLCDAYLNRNKFLKLSILDQTEKQINRFFNDLYNIIYPKKDYDRNFFSNKYYIIDKSFSYSMYNKSTENLQFLDKSGKLLDFSEATNIFINEKNEILSKVESRYIFINLEILKSQHKLTKVTMRDIDELISLYDSRNHLEIEQKYLVSEKLLFSEIQNYLHTKFKKSFKSLGLIHQEDTYYDTLERDFSTNNESLRIRSKNGENILTFKTSLSSNSYDLISEQNERFEFEEKIDDIDINNHLNFIKDKTKLDIKIEEKLVSDLIIIKNNRDKYLLVYHNTNLEIVFDDFQYFKLENNKEMNIGSHLQIEIELKSSFSKKINLVKFCDELSNKYPNIIKTTKSKLQMGLEYLEGNRSTIP